MKAASSAAFIPAQLSICDLVKQYGRKSAGDNFCATPRLP